jgi:hypothetical protein
VCDAEGCGSTPTLICNCGRCKTENELVEQFHACSEHVETVENKHRRIRGPKNVVRWCDLFTGLPATKGPTSNTMPASELFARARDCLASTSCRSEDREVQGNKSRSYVEDARLFAKAIMLLERLVAAGHVEIEVERE